MGDNGAATMGDNGAATQHGKAFLQSTIGQHPVATAMVMGAMLLAIMLLAYYAVKYHGIAAGFETNAPAKSTFGVVSVGNQHTGGNNPQWHMGGADAGRGGSLDRATTVTQAAIYTPSLRQHHSSCGGAVDPAAIVDQQALCSIGGEDCDNGGLLSDTHLNSMLYDDQP